MIDQIVQHECAGCGFCEIACPMDVIRTDPVTRKPYIAYRKDCQTCFLCEHFCPVGAIKIGLERSPKYSTEFIWSQVLKIGEIDAALSKDEPEAKGR